MLIYINFSFDFLGLKADFQSSHEAPRSECLHLIKMNCLALWLDESAHASLAASCEELRARTGNPLLDNVDF
jgi:hypothetical protein